MEFENPRLFIGGVAEETDEATLRQHFSEYGEVKDALIIPRKRIGFVSFSDPLMAKNALQAEDHIILGRKVDVKPAEPRIEIRKRKIFVGGLPSTITLEEFKEYFGNYGRIVDAVVIYDKVSQKFRGFGFVTYDSEEAAANVLRKNFHQLKNKMVEVKRAQPKEKMKIRDCGPLAIPPNTYTFNTTQPGFNLHPGSYYSVGFWVPVQVPDGFKPHFGNYAYGHVNFNP
ncbi:hypothetical protein REPUB_Repub09cG0148500 [Reevesia pubescens]